MNHLRIAFVSLLCITSLACANTATSVVLADIEAPSSVAFVCASITTDPVTQDDVFDGVVPLDNCTPLDDEDAQDESPFILHAVLTQLFRGEIAAINLRENEVLDINRIIPGATFFSVGERPTAVVIPPNAPDYTYVAHLTSRDIWSVPTAYLLNGPPSADSDAGAVDDGVRILELPSGASDLVLSPDGAFLYVALPLIGEVRQIEITEDGDFGAMTTLSLAASAPQVVPPVLDGSNEYLLYCPEDREPNTVRVEPRDPVDLGSDQPTRLTMLADASDPSMGTLLVADEGRPLVRRFQVDAGGAAELTPINVAVPTVDVVVTPAVPKTFSQTAGAEAADTERYLYAIDALDGSVMAVDYTTASPTFGAVLPVQAGTQTPDPEIGRAAHDRILLTGNAGRALTLEVITPNFRDATDGTLCNPNNSEQTSEVLPTQLRGVFLAIGTSAGSMRVVDVYDLDGPCRGGGESCGEPVVAGDEAVSLRRHRARTGVRLTQIIDLRGRPTLQFEQVPGRLEDDGRQATGDGPFLEPVECPTNMLGVFGTGPNICAVDDPWSAPTQAWEARWEGVIPLTTGGLGRFDADNPGVFIADDGAFCRRGVVGADAAPALASDDPEAGYVGDGLVITAELPPISEDLPRCNGLDDVDLVLGFAITAAEDDRLMLGAPLRSGYTLEDVMACFTEYTTYEVRTRNAYTVQGGQSGFIHRVISDDMGRCRFDPSHVIDPDEPDTLLVGRAIAGRLFTNPFVRFHISEFTDQPASGPAAPPDTEAILRFTMENRATPLFLSTRVGGTGSVPHDLVFLGLNDSLYIVDSAIGFGRIELQPLGISQYVR